MTSYTNLFGGTPIYPSRSSYRAVALTANTTLAWGFEGSTDVVADIMDVSSDAARDLTMPDARKASPGTTFLIKNTGSYTVTLKNNSGTQIVAMATNTSYTVYLKTNSTAAGTWGYIEAGAVTGGTQAADLDGYGLVALSNVLNLKFEVSSFSAAYTAALTDRAKILQWTGGTDTLTLPDPSTMTNSWFIGVKNDGSGTLTIDPAGGVTIDGASTLAMASQDSFFIVSDGAEYLTVGRGRSATVTTEYISISIAGTGDYTLNASQQGKQIYRFTGLLTGNRAIIIPATVALFIVHHSTTGGFTITVKTSGGAASTAISSGRVFNVYCDGTDSFITG